MRHLQSFLFFLLICTFSISKAQTSLGIEGGVSSGYLNTNISNRASTSIAYDAGYTFDIPFQYKIKHWLYIETAPGITQKNYTINRTDTFAGIYESFINTYLQLPVMTKFVYGNRLQVFGEAGIYCAYWLGGRVQGEVPNIFGVASNGDIELSSYNEQYKFNSQVDNRFEFGWIAALGAQYHLTKKYMAVFSCRDYQGLTSQQKNYAVNEIPQYNQTFTFSLGVMMKLR